MYFDKDPLPPPPPYSAAPVYSLPITSDLSHINDYLSWSVVNLFFGFGFFGLIPLIFSIVCRNNKNINNLSGAQTMSALAFAFNILITIGGVIGWTIIIIYTYIYLTTHNILI